MYRTSIPCISVMRVLQTPFTMVPSIRWPFATAYSELSDGHNFVEKRAKDRTG
jgi:hypothetical protein